MSIGTSRGYKIFNCEPFGKCYSRFDGGIGIVEMLFCTSLVAIVGIGDQPSMSPRRLKIINTKRHSTICELTFPTTILAVKLNKSRLVVLLEEQIYIYDINNMRLLHTIETAPNVNGLCALSPTIDNNFLVYSSPSKLLINAPQLIQQSQQPQTSNSPTLQPNQTQSPTHQLSSNGSNNNLQQLDEVVRSNHNGDVIVFNAQTLQPVIVIEAHKTSLAAITISYDGTLMATASDKGTIIRVFSIETGIKLFQFRRGTYPTKIYSLSFSSDNKYLTASSSTETVHIFKLGADECVHSSDAGNNLEEHLDLQKPPTIKRSESSGSSNNDNCSISSVNNNSSNQRKLSSTSFESVGSSQEMDKVEPLIDITRRSVGRMIRKSSQNIGRKAAEKIGTFLPPKLSSILEPTRHFASLKVPTANGVKNVVSIGKEIMVDKNSIDPLFHENNNEFSSSSSNSHTSEDNMIRLISISVLSSDGSFYNYGLDPERGGDCILLNQYSLTDSQ